MKWDRNIFLKNCQALCKRNKINKEQFNEKIGLTGALSKWKKASPRKEKLFKICDEFNCSMDWLITGIEPQLPDSADDNIKNERDLYRELAEERKKRTDMLEKENQELKKEASATKDQLKQMTMVVEKLKIANLKKRHNDPDDLDTSELREQVYELFGG